MKRDRDYFDIAAHATREQTERARSELASRSVDNISVYEAARPPTRGDSTKRIIAIAAAIFGLLTALAIGLLRAWSVSSLPTSGAVERTLGLPVLGAARDRAS
jgi:capsular polysaccharide biosynthesis protein